MPVDAIMSAVHGHFYLGSEHRALGRGKVSAGGRAWPRAGRADLEAARASLAPVRPEPALAAVERAAEVVAGELGPLLEARLGLDRELARRAASRVGAVAAPVDRARRHAIDPRQATSPQVLLGHWTHLGDRPLELLSTAFERGRPVLWLGDEHLPEVPLIWATALAEAGLDPRALALLHAPDLVLAAELAAVPPTWEPGELRLEQDFDPELAAAHCVAAAFDDWPALGGRRAGALRRVRCDPRRFSALTEALVARIDGFGDPLPPLDRGARRELAAALELALDRGGTPVRGGDGSFRPTLVVHADPTPDGAAFGVSASVPLLELERLWPGPAEQR